MGKIINNESHIHCKSIYKTALLCFPYELRVNYVRQSPRGGVCNYVGSTELISICSDVSSGDKNLLKYLG
jgi:hypothetical protein